MRKLIAVTYDTEFKAEEVRLQFLKMQKSYLVSLEDAVVVEKKQNGKVKLHQMYNLTASGAVGGGFWGVLIGLIFMNPLLGLVVGAGAGAVAGALVAIALGVKQTLPLPAIWGWPLATNVVGYLASVFIGALICALGVLYVSPKNAR